MDKCRTISKVLLTVLIVGILSFSCVDSGNAVPMQDPLEIIIPVVNKVTGNPESHLNYVFILEPVDDAPLQGDAGQITMVGPGEGQFGPITFSKPGEYRYIAYLQEQQADNYTFDKTKYDVLIVVESTNENGLIATVVATKNGETEKSNKLQFVNKLKGKPGERLPQTGLMWWPVYVLAGVGVMAIILGVLVQRRKKNG